jgi:DNA repair protein RecO (recombination protein O)
MIERLHAIVLAQYDTGDTSEIVHVLSAEQGPLSIVAKGSRNPKSRVRALLQPLALLEMSVARREDSDIATLREASLVRAHSELGTNLQRLAHACLIAETASLCSTPHQPAHAQVELVTRATDELAECDLAMLGARTAQWLLLVLEESGHAPQLADELLAPWAGPTRPLMFWLDVERGRVHAEHPQPILPPEWPFIPARVGHYPLPPEGVRAIYDAMQNPVPPPLDPPEELRGALAHQLIEALLHHLQHHVSRGVRSAKFWRSMRGK